MSAPSPRPGFFVTWCRLLRAPNLFTVPGDVLAGYVLATGGGLDWPVVGGVCAVLFLYMGGLLLNDFFDRKKDGEERPDRPIPSGAADPWTVLGIGILFLAAGVGIAFAAGGQGPFVVALLIAVAALAYDSGLKEIPWVGPLVMGSCRAGGVLVGAALVAGGLGSTPARIVAGIAWVYTFTITVLAAREASGVRLKDSAYWPPVLLVAAPVVLILGGGWQWQTGMVALFLLACGAIRTGLTAGRMQRVQIVAPIYIGVCIRAMIFSQAAWCIWQVPKTLPIFLVIAATFAVLFACAEILSRWFQGS